MELYVIKTRKQYEDALAIVEELMDQNIEHNSKENERLKILALLIENYEKKHFII
jgi:antitoxin component HigA of HigAB toxin-antitoxin module